MNNLQLPPADASPAQIKAALAELMRLHPNVMQGVIDAVRGFYPLDAHTLTHMRKLIAHHTMRHQYPKGRDFEQGENYAFARIDEVLANAIEQAGGPEVKPEYTETEQKDIKNGICINCNNIPFTAPDWRTSLRQRPKTTDQ